ncbi:hypothetical protein MIR68_011812 [Amoeboaphelidium protococcarum]|nr:hypothetical protein MIR68_011812 [Amoeboaphelidium protococcarum]
MHLEHRIPWSALDKVLKFEQHPKDPNKKRLLVDEAGLSVVGHFARCLHDAITEFESTDKSTLIESERYNIRSWKCSYGQPIQLSGGQGYLGSKMSVVAGYVKLNLLLLNWSKYRQMLFSPSYRSDWVLDVCSGQRDGGHPEWLAQRMRAIWDSDVPLKTRLKWHKRCWTIVKISFAVCTHQEAIYLQPRKSSPRCTGYLDFGAGNSTMKDLVHECDLVHVKIAPKCRADVISYKETQYQFIILFFVQWDTIVEIKDHFNGGNVEAQGDIQLFLVVVAAAFVLFLVNNIIHLQSISFMAGGSILIGEVL